jgi:HEAT repeat protein
MDDVARAGLWGARPGDGKHPDARLRAEAARQDAGLAEQLLHDPEPAVRLAAAAGVTSQEALLELSRDEEPLVRARVASRLNDLEALVRLAEDPSSLVRVVALHALVQGGSPEAEPVFLKATRHGDAYVRWKAAAGLHNVERLAELTRDEDCDVRREAVRRLGRVARTSAEKIRARTALEAALGDTNSFVRRWAAEALGNLGDAVARPVLQRAAEDPTGLVAASARGALQALGQPTEQTPWRPPRPPGDEAALRALLTSPDATLRKDGAKFAAGRADAVERLLPLGSDPDSEVRKSVGEALGRALLRKTDPRGESQLARALLDPDPDTRITALDSLRQLRRVPAEALPAVRASLAATDTEQRLRAAEALAGDPALPAELLAPALEDPDERVRAAAVARLPGKLRAGEPSALVRRAAGAGAGALDGADPGRAPWREGAWAREDDLLHVVFSWNREEDRPASHRALRPPLRRPYGHPDRG